MYRFKKNVIEKYLCETNSGTIAAVVALDCVCLYIIKYNIIKKVIWMMSI